MEFINAPQYPSIAYLGGFFDGEGSIGLYNGSLCVRVTNTDLAILGEYLKGWGGAVVPHTPAGPRRKECRQWKAYGQEAADFLVDVFGHLREKRMQAFMGLEYRRMEPSDPKRAWVLEQLRAIKHLGRKPALPWFRVGAL